MKEALVINPRLFMGGGGDLVCLHTIRALQQANYHVNLFCDSLLFPHIDMMFGNEMRHTLGECNHIPIFAEDFRARPCTAPLPRIPVLHSFQRLIYAKKSCRRLEQANPEVVFHTQPSVHFVPNVRTFQFVYELDYLKVLDFYHEAYRRPRSTWKRPYFALLRTCRNSMISALPTRRLLALSSHVLDGLKDKGFQDSALIFPPCRNLVKPMEKKRQVVTVARIVPEKRLEVFCEVASRLPDCNFIIVGRESPEHLAYKWGLISRLPPNVRYVESPIVLRPELLGESKVYLHAGRERGFGIAITEGLFAGCVPVCFVGGDGAEVVKRSEVGFIFADLDQAVKCVRDALDSKYPTPQEISEKAKMFSPEIFEMKIHQLVTN